MSATDADLMRWVEERLRSDPEVTVDELFEGAKAMNPEVGELNKRQFHARYPLQVKRRRARMEAAAAEEAAAAGEDAPVAEEAAPVAEETEPDAREEVAAPAEEAVAPAEEEEAAAPVRGGAASHEDLMAWVEAQLRNDPGVTVDELFEGAKVLNPDVGELNKRQFHARYPLQVKRRRARMEAAAAEEAAATGDAPVAEEAAPVAEETEPDVREEVAAPAEEAAALVRDGAATHEDLMAWVEAQLRNDPGVTVGELFEGAKVLNPDVGELSKLQFHARYPLQVKRRQARMAEAAARKSAPPAKKASPARKRKTAPAPVAEEVPAAAPAAEARVPAGIDREAVRKALFDFAADITSAEDTTGVVKVLAAMDDYIDRIV